MEINNEITTYDVMVVYSESDINNAISKKDLGKTPFSSKGSCGIYNDSYRYFLLKCKKMGIKAAFATSKDIIGPGLFQNFWIYDKKWIRKHSTAYSQVIFDKFVPDTIEQDDKLKLFSSTKSIYMFNNKKISALFQNKSNTFKHFEEFAIPTVVINNPSKKEMILAKTKLDKILKKHRSSVDFEEGYIIKDITGAGGFNIHKVYFDKSGFKEILKHYEFDKKNKKRLSYILQPFINCDTGFEYNKKYGGPIDLRIIVLNTKIIQTYIRIAEKGKFECNIHQGGNLFYISEKIIPEAVLEMSKKIIKKLGAEINLKHSLYALDFMISNNGNVYFIEGNDTPGIIWEHKNEIDKAKTKELIDIIVNELKLIIQEKKI
ncbi:hypothetical protein HQ545_00160 [Candidatus Woesearchaeota archaeon]|nr:hypothetical protein [Candidatus Woesearchaeota archaeon]